MINYKFLNSKETQKQLSTSDEFTKNLSPFSLQMYHCRNEQDYLKSISTSNCFDFSSQEKNRISGFMESINKNLAKLKINVNLDVCFSKTLGQESLGLPYTRTNTIVITVPYLMAQASGMKVGNIDMGEGLISHEIFHVLSRKFPQIREALYSLHNFKHNPTNESVSNVVTNPDAPNHDYTVEVTYQGKTKEVRPLIAMINMDMMNADKQLLVDGKFINQNQTNYLDVIESNSKFNTYHPEEVCAENFRILIQGEDFKQKKEFLKILQSL